jgi:hypothetical protein
MSSKKESLRERRESGKRGEREGGEKAGGE